MLAFAQVKPINRAPAAMTNYRRNRVEGGTYFFTVKLEDRDSQLLVEQVDVLREAVRIVRAKAPFHIDAWAVLPNHLHSVWTLPAGDMNFSLRWRDIKSEFSRGIPKGEYRSPSRRAKQERGIWQRRFWEHTIRDDHEYGVYVDYVHFNAVKHGLVSRASEWRYSSFHRAVQLGIYPEAWAACGAEPEGTGE